MQGNDEELKKLSAATLKSISGQDFGMDAAKWAEWNQSRPK